MTAKVKRAAYKLYLRAGIAGLLAFGVQLQASDTWDGSLLRSAILGGALAAIEYLTPLNSDVGPGK